MGQAGTATPSPTLGTRVAILATCGINGTSVSPPAPRRGGSDGSPGSAPACSIAAARHRSSASVRVRLRENGVGGEPPLTPMRSELRRAVLSTIHAFAPSSFGRVVGEGPVEGTRGSPAEGGASRTPQLGAAAPVAYTGGK